MQNNDNQTNQKDPNNRGQNGFESISPGLCSIWLGMRDSNPRSWDQNPVPYRLANPHWLYILYSTLEFESDSTHVQRARNFAIANQLASEGFLADC